MRNLTDAEFLRYSRQIMLPEVGETGQQALASASVLLVGAGGLGSAASLYLAAAGVGNLVIADDDRVDTTNLQRQVVYRDGDTDSAKVIAISRQLAALNPGCRVRPVHSRLAGERLDLEVAQADIVLDCSDNMATRYAVNKACCSGGKLLVSGAAVGWQGQLMVFDFRQPDSACYQCLFPDAGDSEPRNCSASGVSGPVVGTIGNLQALETIKALCGLPVSAGKLLHFNGLDMSWKSLSVVRDLACPACSSVSVSPEVNHVRCGE